MSVTLLSPAMQKALASKQTTEIDGLIGGRIRLRREQIKMTAVNLADRLGVARTILGRYQNGKVRLSAARLYEISKILETPIGFFFEDIPGDTDLPTPDFTSMLAEPGALDLLNDYLELPADQRTSLRTIAASLVSAQKGQVS